MKYFVSVKIKWTIYRWLGKSRCPWCFLFLVFTLSIAYIELYEKCIHILRSDQREDVNTQEKLVWVLVCSVAGDAGRGWGRDIKSYHFLSICHLFLNLRKGLKRPETQTFLCTLRLIFKTIII